MSDNEYTPWQNFRNMLVLLSGLLGGIILWAFAATWIAQGGTGWWWGYIVLFPSAVAAMFFAAERDVKSDDV